MSGGPWRKVTLIEDHKGTRGGTQWCLTLECGHIIFQSKPTFRISDMFRGGLRNMAPKKKRCLVCKPYAEAS